jgi:3-deoxy-D-manno-octulosonic acid kinase
MSDAAAGEARVTVLDDGAALHDARRLGAQLVPGWFDPGWWEAAGCMDGRGSGRGEVQFVRTEAGLAVLRHYRRGGMLARLNRDRYWYQGPERTRPFREYRLLAWASAQGLPVPAPLAARYRRQGHWYTADLLSAAIPHTRSLAQALQETPRQLPWASIGTAIAKLHAAGVFHADLNAHNVLLDGECAWLVDFDRGERRVPAPAWQQANLARLERSLTKLGAREVLPAFEREVWPVLCAAHAQALQSTVRRA